MGCWIENFLELFGVKLKVKIKINSKKVKINISSKNKNKEMSGLEKEKIKDKIKETEIQKRINREKDEIEKNEIYLKKINEENWPSKREQIYSKYRIPISENEENWPSKREQIYSKYRIPISENDEISVFFLTDERMIRNIYREGGDKAIEKYARNLVEQGFLGGPITSTLIRRVLALRDEKNKGNVIDTEIDIDGLIPNSRIQYALKEIDLDGQVIPARKKFAINSEMTSSLDEGFHVGPFVAYDDIYLSSKEEMKLIIADDDIKEIEKDRIEKEEKNNIKGIEKDRIEKEEKNKELRALLNRLSTDENIYIQLCEHGNDINSYCSKCHGDIIVSPSKRKVIGMCLDISGSMQGMALNNAKRAVIKVLNNIPQNSNIEISLIAFSTDIPTGDYEEIIPYNKIYTKSEKERAIRKINLLRSGGSTPLYSAINYFLDKTWSEGALDKNKIFFPYTYLIILTDGRENQSKLSSVVYEGKIYKEAFFRKLIAYRNAGLITEIIPFAYTTYEHQTNDFHDIQLMRELKNLSGKALINEVDPGNIIDKLVGSVDSILYGEENLKMIGIPSKKFFIKDEK
jgi:uncharacterized protein YegL